MESDHFFPTNTIPFRILLAEDDEDDRFFFEDALDTFNFNKKLTMLEDGEKLLKYLAKEKNTPDVLFLDYNLPRINGEECLREIKKHAALKDLPVIMYSTYLHEDVADALYELGAHFFVCKTDTKSLKKILHTVFTLLLVTKAARPERGEFIITS